jgi:solute:Na+ symporter, SSS family
LVILSLYWKKMNSNGALAGMLTGAVTVLIWIYAPITINGQSLSSVMYEIVPGFIMATIAIVVVSRLTTKEQPELEAVFEQVAAKH